MQRLHYLKSSVIGEASTILKNISVTDANYNTAWSELKQRYESKRLIVAAHLRSILDLNPMKSESASELKRVYDTINDALHALKNLERKVDDDFVVAIAERKLDVHTLQEWNFHLGNTVEPPLFLEMSKFLVGRLRAIEATLQIKEITNKSNRSGTTKSFVSSVNKAKCPSCSEPHSLYQCTQFKSLSSEKRKKFAKSQRCCYNCLGKGHFPRTCPSQKRCTRCNGKHHSLLHEENENENLKGKTDVKTDSSTEVSVSDTKNTHVLKAQLTLESNPIFPPVLLATARVLAHLPEGRSLQLRALIDSGSEATFVSERATQALHLKRRKTKIKVTGIGDQCNNISNYSAKIRLSPCNNEKFSVSTLLYFLVSRRIDRSPTLRLCRFLIYAS